MSRTDPYGTRDKVLLKMGFASYADYLISDLWSGLRGQVLLEYPNCRTCGKIATVVHHTSYHKKFLQKGGVALVSICRTCHQLIEFREDGTKERFYDTLTKFLCLLTRMGEYDLATDTCRINGRKYSRAVYAGSFEKAMKQVKERQTAGHRKWGRHNAK